MSGSGEHAQGGARPSALSAQDLTLRYDDRVVVDGLSVRVPQGRITVVVGPNACGKSTLLRGLGRLIAPASGRVLLDEVDVRELPARELARRLGVLPQSPTAPEGITVTDLVERGRAPHQGWFGGRSDADDAAVARAMRATGVLDLAERPVDELSGGQRQRVWIAMALAQDTPVMLLDEPTTYLDVTHAVEVLDLLVDRNRAEGTTVVVVLHDLGLAARYADHLIAMRGGAVLAEGRPAEVVTEAVMGEVFGMACRVVPDAVSGTPLVVPAGRHHPVGAAADGEAADGEAADGETAGGEAADGETAGGEAAAAGVRSEAELRAVVDEPHPLVLTKSAPRLDAEAAAFVAASPLALLASVGVDGALDVTPRGDPPGRVLVLDEGRTLAVADRPGNRRLDSARNIVVNPEIALLFLVPGVEHVLRVTGRARVVDDPSVLALWDDLGGAPRLAVLVEVSEQFVHCGRALKSSAVWDPGTWPDAGVVPGLKTLADAARAERGSA